MAFRASEAGHRKGDWRWWAALIALLSVVTFAGLFTSEPYRTSTDVLMPPSTQHWLGTNAVGQDVWTGLLLAAPNTVVIAFTSAFLALAIAVFFAMASAVGVPLVRAGILRMVDMFQTVPAILFLLLVAAWVQPGLLGIVLIIGLSAWQDDVRVIRAAVLRESTRENVQYVRHQGGSWLYCAIHHLIPAVWPLLVSVYLQATRHAVMKTAGLAFLGLTDPRLLTWGGMMQGAMDHLYGDAWRWLLVPPAVCLAMFLYLVLSLGKIAERQSMARSSVGP